MGNPNAANGPFKTIGYIPSIGEMANHLDICVAELKANLRIQGNFKGISRGYLFFRSKSCDIAFSICRAGRDYLTPLVRENHLNL